MISCILAVTMLFGCMTLNLSAAAEDSAENVFETKDGFLDLEAEDLKYDKGLLELLKSDLYSGKKALRPLKEDKNQPAKDAAAALSVQFKADRDGTYYIWMRHTASVARSNGGNLWLSLGGGNYNFTNLKAEAEAPAWFVLGKVELKAGETGSMRILPRQIVSIGYDRFIISADENYTPTDKDLDIKAAAVATSYPIPTPTPTPAAIEPGKDGTYDIIDFSKEDSVKKYGFASGTEHKQDTKFTAQWIPNNTRDIHIGDVNNVSKFNTLKIRVYGNSKLPVTFLLQFMSNDPDTEGDDYYGKTIVVDKDGWQEFVIPFTELGKTRSPLGYDQISRISLRTKGWDIENPEGSVLYFDKVQLVRDEAIAKEEELLRQEEEAQATSDPKDLSKVADAVCLFLGNGHAYSKQQRVAIDPDNPDVVPFTENDRTLVPVRFISEQLGAEVNYDGATEQVWVKKDGIEIDMTIGSNTVYKNGQAVTLDVAANTYNDRTFVPLRACAELLNKQVYWHDMGLIVISDKENIYDDDKDLGVLYTIIQNIIFDRPTGEQMMADLRAQNPDDAHPRLLANAQQIAQIKERAKTDSVLQSWIDSIEKSSQGILEQPTVEFIDKLGYDNGMLTVARTAKEKLYKMAFLYQFTGEDKYAARAWKELEEICSWPDWHPGHFLDTGELSYGVSLAYDWCYDYFTPEQRKTIEDALHRNAVMDGIGAYNGTTDKMDSGTHNRSGWTKATTNWNAVCNAGLLMASAAIANVYPEDCTTLFGNIIKSVELGVKDYAPDGGYAEGPGYWEYGTTYLVWLIASMDSAFGTNYGLYEWPGVSTTQYYAAYVDGPTGTFNYSDSGSGHLDGTSSFWFAKKNGDPDLAGLRYNKLIENGGGASPKDVIWYDPDNISTRVELGSDRLFKGIDTAFFRTNWTDSSMVFAGFHGGKNNSNHGNLDVGTFVLDAEGERWFIDLGGDSYSLPDYFGAAGRGTYYRGRAEGQNTVCVNPDKKADQVYTARGRITDYVSKPKGAYAIMDMKSALSVLKVSDAKRGMLFTNNRRAVVVQDEMTLLEPGEVWWFAHTQADIEVAPDGKSAVLTQNGKRMSAVITSDNDAKFTVMDAVKLPTSPATHELDNKNAGIRKLAIHLTGVKDVNLAVTFRMLDEGESEPSYQYSYTKMENWQIPDGALAVPTLTDVRVNGQTVENFNPFATDYTVILPYGTTEVPAVEAAASEGYEYTLTMPDTLPGMAKVKVYDPNDTSISQTYSVFIRAQKGVEIVASHNQEGNTPENSMDGDFVSRWAAEGSAWIKYTFIEPREISSVWIAYYSATEKRKARLEIQVSEDGENFVSVFKGMSTASKVELEEFKLPKPMTVKAVKVLGDGNTVNNWNVIAEIDFR